MAKKSIQHEKNTCPYCGSEDVEYWDTRWFDGESNGEEYHCTDCDRFWTNWYERRYAETIIEEEEED